MYRQFSSVVSHAYHQLSLMIERMYCNMDYSIVSVIVLISPYHMLPVGNIIKYLAVIEQFVFHCFAGCILFLHDYTNCS